MIALATRRRASTFVSIASIVWLLTPSLAAQNPIVTENQLAGSPPSAWYVAHPGSANIQGFATDMSVNRGDTVRFKIDTNSPAYHIDVYRLGWYQGNGARLVGAGVITASLPQTQPQPVRDLVTGLADCGNWAESAHWDVPANAVSGIYQAKLTRDDPTPGTSVITFLVRDDASTSDVLFQTSDTTWQAYNVYGGMSLYPAINGGPPGFNHATKVSYNRPFDIRHSDGSPGDDVFAAEYPMVRWLERNGYHVTYWSSVDTARRGNLLTQHRLYLSVGHDEYWSGPARTNVTAARDAGVHCAFFSGNELYWKIRFEASIDGTSTPWRTVVCYKEGTQGENVCGGKCDPSPQWTGLWRDGCAPTYTANDACLPENAVTGQIGWDGTIGAIQVPASFKQLRFWRNTSIASLGTGQTATLCQQSLGSEWDPEQPQYAASYPSRRIKLSSTLLAGKTHHLSLYRANSGAFVFGAGTIQWSWGLDEVHTFAVVAPNPDMQQATVNLFADMGVQPATLQSGLVPAAASTDTQAPTSILGSPSTGSSMPQNNAIVFQGTATDVGGGTIGGVEVSVDGGVTWRAANGTTNWNYTWQPPTTGTFTVKCRAFDDTCNLEATGSIGAPNVITINVTPPVCPCTVFSPSQTPTVTGNDAAAIETGMKFRTTTNGQITALRYYRAPGTTGTRIGSLWTSTGVNLAQQAFTADTASGWQQIALAAPVAITAGTTYVVSCFSPSGDYVATQSAFLQPTGPGPIFGLANGTDGPNGIYTYALTPTFPTLTFNATNYFVDVVFATGPDTTPPTVVARTPAAGASNVGIASVVTATFDEGLDPATVNSATFELRDATSALVPASVAWSGTSLVATLLPNAPLLPLASYTVIVRGGATGPRVKDLAGNALAANAAWTFQTAAVTPNANTVFAPTSAPGGPLFNDHQPSVGMELGMRFRADVNGSVTAIRFYKGAGTTGTHVGNLWTNTGTNLAQVAFTNETASGWQEVPLPAPVAITANTTYVVSCFTSTGDYVATNNVFTQTLGAGTVHGLANGVDGPNGIYLYTAASAFPTQTFQSSSYWIDVAFSAGFGGDVTPPTIVTRAPATNATSVATTAVITATFSEPLTAATVNASTLELRDAAGALVPATISYTGATNSATLTPLAPLATLSTYSVTVRGGTIDPRVKDVAGNALAANATWSFTTGVLQPGPFTVFAPSTVSPNPRSNDGSPITVGMKFRTDVDGVVTALRYYKAAGTTGTRTGTVWTAGGTNLGQAVFTNETASGWQEVPLATPIAVTANTTYVVSYFSSSGDYTSALNWFTVASGTGPVHGLANGTDGPNGVYAYGAAPALPTQTFNASNYFVDVVFSHRHVLTTTTSGNGTVTRSPDQPSYANGSTVALTAAPAPGWSFTGWSGAASTLGNPLLVRMDASKSVTATFVNGPAHEPYGTGCYDLDRESFWQRFPTAAAASAALSGQSMVLTPSATGYTVTRGGGTWIPPSGLASALPASDEGQTSIALAPPLPIPGGSAATLWVHSNGFVSTGPQNGTLFAGAAPSAAFLDAPNTAWWSWHDFVPTEPGSGAIVREQLLVAGHQVLCITWNGVESRAVPETVNRSSMQFQFDLTSGVVTYVWQNLTPIGTNGDPLHPEATLVGFSPGGASTDPGAIDLATALPIVTEHIRPLQLGALPSPQTLGSGSSNPMTWTLREVPDAAPPLGVRVAILWFSFASAPGFDLALIGAPRCTLNIASLDVPFVVLTGAGASTTQALQLVFPPPLAPGTTFYSQAIALFPGNSFPDGLNGFGLLTSNGVKTTF